MVRRRGNDLTFVSGEPINFSKPESAMGGRAQQQKDFFESGSAGREVRLQPASPAGNNVWVTLVKITTDEDKKSIPVTVTFGGTGPVASPLSPQGRGAVRARVTWGSGGAIETAEIDYVNGQAITFVCSSIIVDMRNDSTDDPTVRAFVAKGGKAGSNIPVTLTIPFNATLPTAVGTNVEIPAFAKQVQVYKSNPAADLSVRVLLSGIYDPQIAPVDFITYRVDAPAAGQQLPLIVLAGSAQWVQPVNNGASPSNIAGVCIFYLGL